MSSGPPKSTYTEEQLEEIFNAYADHMRQGFTHTSFRYDSGKGLKCTYRNIDAILKKRPELAERFFESKIDQQKMHETWCKAQILGQINGSSPTLKFWMANIHGWRLSDKKEDEAEKVSAADIVVSNKLPFER